MFEGLVRQLLVGYLGRYIKDIHRDQLKITLWNEEVLLENVELILEAFDYLQLPFALKQGRVGKLSIKIPWKKLGWDPIIIVLEDLYVCAAQRGDEEWSLDAVERREFAGKKAKLAAAELAKLSRRVCDNHTGKSFVSFITAKILDNIQVSIQNFHVLYHDVESVSGQIVLGLRLSRLTIMRQQPLGSLSGWTRGGLVNKVVDIVGLEIYCHTSRDAADKISIESLGDSKLWANERLSSNDRDSILAPCDVSMSLSVSRSGKLDNSSPQYSISAELTGLVFSLDELQLQQILVLWDYLCTCQLRDRYGRFRPWGSPISKRIRGWQILWWHYAQESVLSDVRKKLKKTSWRYLGQRLSYRRKYVNLYKIKLEFLQLDQSVDENILEELEEMEKESEIDDILSYRSAAESELQHLFYSPTTRNGITGLHTSVEKSRIDDRLIGRSRGWLNWLSRGMLGAGGTDDSSQFSGVVSDEIIEDIYEATKFQPLVSSIGDVTEDLIEDDKVCSRAIKFGIEQISTTLWSRKYGQEVTEMIFNGTIVECRLSEESATISVLVNSVEILNPCNRNVVVMINKPINEKDLDTERTSNTFQVHVSPSHEILSPSHEIDLSVKVMIRPVEVTYDTQFFRCFIEFFDGFRSFEFLHERVLSSLDGIGNVNARLLSKAKYILSNRKTVMWDISIINVTINVPWTNANFEQPNLVLELGALLLTSKHNPGSPSSSVKENLFTLKNLNASVSSYEFSLPLQLEDIYDHFEVKLNDIEMKITIPSHSKRISMFEKFNASISLGTCLIPDQLLVKQLEVFLILSPLRAYFSPSTYEAVLGLIASQFDRSSNPSYMISETDGPHPLTLKEHKNPVFGFSVCASLQSVSFQVNLENGGENSYALLLVLEELEAWYALTEVEECRICIKELNITVHPIRGKGDRHTLFSCGTHSPITSSSEIQNNVGREGVTDKNMSTKSCFLLHYESHTANVIHPKGTIHLNNAEIHCYPYVIGLLIGFYERLLRCSTLFSSENSCTPLMNAENTKLLPTLGFQRFGFSNFFEVGSSEYTSIPTDCFPFVTIQNKGFLGNIESSLVYTNSDWRKHLETKDGKMFIPEAGVNRGLPSIASGSSCQTNVCVIELNFCGIRVHFHDSSSIIGSITLPTSKSSILICEDYMDMLCSTEGLILSSPWWTKNLRNFLWGPSLPCLSPVLNVRLRSLNSQQEISISVQHVYCILPPEYLAIIIGYFSLPDWVNTNEQFGSQGSGYKDSEEDIMYKFEILDSLLIFPTESNELQFLKFEISQLCCSFFMGTSSNDALKDIPSEYLVPIHKVATSNRCLNMFGQDLFLSFLLFKDGISDCSMFDHSTECRDISLVASLSADLWVRIPDMNASVQNSGAATCIMTRIHTCEVVADDCHMVGGFEALAEIINQLSFVEDCSKCFKSDVLQYFQLQRCLKEKSAPPTISSSVSSAEIRCCANSLFLKMHRYSKGKTEVISEVEMQFTCLASFENNNILMLDISFASLQLYSRKKSVVLARFSSVSSILLALNICLSKSSEGENELHVCLPSADVWLHLSEWNEVLDLFNSFSGQVANSSAPDSILVNLESESIDPLINSAVSSLPDDLHSSNRSACLASENMERDSLVLILRSNNVGITLHLPVSAREPCRELLVGEVEHKSPQGRSSYIEVTLHSREIEVFVNGRAITLKYDIKMLRGLISLSEDKHVQSWPFIQIFEVYLEADIICNPIVPLYVKSRVQFDRFDLWLSHHVFSFWYDLHYDIPEVGSSHPATLCGIELEIQGRKASVLLSDGRWSFCGPLLEILVKNIHFCASVNENSMEDFITGELQVNYNNIQKVFWEPFIEPWLFEMNVIRKNQSSTLLNSSVMTDIRVVSSLQLNLNITESLVECIARADEMVRDAWGMSRPNDATESQKLLNFPFDGNISTGSYAPYILQNLTSLPLLYHVYQGQGNLDEFDVSDFKEENRVWPATSIPIYINESPEEQLFHLKSSHSFERLTMLKTNGDAHHFISIQLDGTSVPSIPISIDLVGRRYFEVDFLKPPENEIDLPGNVSKDNENIEENLTDASGGFIIPVVIDVSVQRYSKLVRLYSTVILFNTTSVPLELRFDIPFGVSPMVLDPLYPGQEVPLPLHLAEAGRMRWRPIGSSYLWSEAYNLSNLLSHENKVGLFRSFVCYPSHPSSDPFRCCMSVRNIVLPSVVISKKMMSDLKKSVTSCGQAMRNLTEAGKRSIHQVTLSTPLVVKNHLPKELQLTVDTGGIKHTAILSEVETFFHHVDPLHDLALEIHMQGFRPSAVRLPRAETFCAKAKFGGTKYSLSETITFNPDLSNGPIYITMEKAIDAFSGARELSIFVPFLLYNCTGIPLLISESVDELRGVSCIIPSCYDRVEQELVLGKRDGLRALTSSHDSHSIDPDGRISFSIKNIVSTIEDANPHSGKLPQKCLSSSSCLSKSYEQSNKNKSECQNFFASTFQDRSSATPRLNTRDSNFVECEHGKVRPCMFSPNPDSPANEVVVRAGRPVFESGTENMPSSSRSSPFSLIPPNGSTTILVPQSSPNSAFIISVTTSAVSGPFSEKINAITFQPRYVISNACSRDLYYKQKGTDFIFKLGIGEHSHLHWMDTTRELLVSVLYEEPGWQWSGGFLPDHLGDTQLKMRNFVSAALNIIRVEVQNVDVSLEDEQIVGSLHGNSGTNLILLSDDDTGYMPYRIDNFSKERLQIYQTKCEPFETIVHSYTSCPYAWDEPSYPHRLTVEVPGERVLGSYALDDVKEYMPVNLPSTSEKPARILYLSVHAEGATKVLSIIDSTYHIPSNSKDPSAAQSGEKRKNDEKQDNSVDYKEKITVVIPYIGLSFISSYPEELVFACAKDMTIDLLQSLDRQKFSLKLLSLQIDNQLRNTPYPVILSFDLKYKSNLAGNIRNKDVGAMTRSERMFQITSDSFVEPVFYLAASKWRKKDISLVSFEHISLRVADFFLELEQELILCLFEFLKNVASRFQNKLIPFSDPSMCPLIYDSNRLNESSSHKQTCECVNARKEHLRHEEVPIFNENNHISPSLLPSVVPIGAPWQQIYLLARKQKKIYVELFNMAPITVTLSFSSAPWTLRDRVVTSGELLIHRGLMALADIEGAQIHLKQLTITHHMASWGSIQEIIIRHYMRQLLHEMYKVFGSAGVIGNPMGFARSLGVGIRDFLSVPAKGILQSPTGLVTGMAQGTSSLLSNTVYAISDAATQFSKAAHKGIVAFTFDDQSVSRLGMQQMGVASRSEGVISEVLEGLTGLLQSPIRGAEKHGLPGVLSGIALGITGLVAKPAASILEVTGKTAQSIRNRSRLYHTGQQRFRVRLPRPLSRDLPLRPFSWEGAVGTSVLVEAGLHLKDEVLVMCKALKQAGKFVMITERLILVVSCSSLVDLGKPEFRGIDVNVEWVIETEIGLESVIHADGDTDEGVVHVVGSSSDSLSRQKNLNHSRKGVSTVRWDKSPTPLPLFQTNLELARKEEAEIFLQVLLSTIEVSKDLGWGAGNVLHRHNIVR